MGAKVAFDALLDAFEFVSFEGEGRCDSRLLPPARSLREIQEPAGG
jgi:hypothetical protein